MLHGYLPIFFFMCTVVPLSTSDSTCISSIKASINANPRPERSCSGFVVNKAPAAKVEAEKEKLEKYKEMMDKVTMQLKQLIK